MNGMEMSDIESKSLCRDDIVGKPIRCVYRSEWDEDDDGFAGCAVFVELPDGVVFELQGVDYGDVVPVLRVDRGTVKLIKVESAVLGECRGKTIDEVVASELWPAIGVRLRDDTVLFIWGMRFPASRGVCGKLPVVG